MKQIATVEELLPHSRVKIVVARQTACAHDCRDCAGCGATAAPIRATADNPIGARVGEKVVVESSSRHLFGVLLLVYLLPVALFFLAYFATAALGNDAIAAAVSIGAFFCGMIPAIRCDRRIRRAGGMTFTVVDVF